MEGGSVSQYFFTRVEATDFLQQLHRSWYLVPHHFLMNFTKAVPKSSIALINVPFRKDLMSAASMGVVAASMGNVSNPLPGGASDEAGFLAAGGRLRAVFSLSRGAWQRCRFPRV